MRVLQHSDGSLSACAVEGRTTPPVLDGVPVQHLGVCPRAGEVIKVKMEAEAATMQAGQRTGSGRLPYSIGPACGLEPRQPASRSGESESKMSDVDLARYVPWVQQARRDNDRQELSVIAKEAETAASAREVSALDRQFLYHMALECYRVLGDPVKQEEILQIIESGRQERAIEVARVYERLGFVPVIREDGTVRIKLPPKE